MKILVVAILALGLSACYSKNNPQNFENILALETYRVPPGLESEVQSALSQLLNIKEVKGRVRSLPGGHILVAASPNFHAGVQKLIKELKSQPSVKESNVRLSISYVAGKASNELKVPKNLRSEEKTLETIYKSQGFGEFRLVEELQNIGKNGQQVTAKGTFLETHNTSRIYNDRSNLIIDVETPFDKVKSNFYINPNQTIVLGKAGFTYKDGSKARHLKKVLGDFIDGDASASNISFFYLVKTEILN